MAKEDLVTTVSTRKLKDGLSGYLRRAERGERIVVMRGKRAVAALVPFETAEGLDDDARLRQLAGPGGDHGRKYLARGRAVALPSI